MSRVDVIIPCYNYGHYLRQCVESLLTQSMSDLRILVIDDASPDNTAEVAAELVRSDPRVEFRRHAANQGHIATYNEGLEWVCGDYVFLISADDVVTPGALRRVVRLLDAHPEVALAYGRDIEFETELPPRKESACREECGWQILPYEAFLEDACRNGHTAIQAPTVVVRTVVHKKVGGYLKELPHTADTEIWLRLAAHGAVGILDAEQAYRRIHRRNMSFNYSPLRRIQEQKAAFDVHFREFGGRMAERERLEQLLNRNLAEAAFWGASRAFDQGEVKSSEEYLAFAVSVDPSIRAWRPWSRFRWKRRLGVRMWSVVRQVAERFRGRPQPVAAM
jgi:glycosyltransferase involved in cell wall biosynthesis